MLAYNLTGGYERFRKRTSRINSDHKVEISIVIHGDIETGENTHEFAVRPQ